ncbi:MAG: hypothetical protein LBE13_10755 [Bacteroidales bacterium]|nr:hypothetical protein [Bacteroidales bacterium]
MDRKEFNIANEVNAGVLKDEEILSQYGKNSELRHRSLQIVCWDSEN